MRAGRLARRTPIVLGVAIGLVVSAALSSVWSGDGRRGAPAADTGVVLSDCDGAIETLVVHYVAQAADAVTPTYRDLFAQLPAEVTVEVVCPDRGDFEDLRRRVGPTRCRLVPVPVGHPVTTWSRDRWLALQPAVAGPTVLLCPRGEEGAAVWPAREGDQRVGFDLAGARRPQVDARRSGLFFDGGDFAADRGTVFVRPRVLLRNLQQTVQTREELIERLEQSWKRRVVLLQEAPDHHVGMYLMPVGNRTILVADPRMAESFLTDPSEREAVDAYLPGGADVSPETVARFDAVAEQCRAAGYRAVRIPTLQGTDGRTFVTYANVILDRRDGHRIVYMPVYACAPTLNREATAVWAGLGYEVRPVACDECSKHFGAVRCLVNVLRRT